MSVQQGRYEGSYVRKILTERGLIDKFTEDDLQEFEALIMPVDTNISIDSVILSKENRGKLDAFLLEQDNRDKLLAHGLYPINRLLLYGASGTGKTYMTKALSNYMGYTMLYVDIATSLSQGTVAMNISNIFRLGNALGHCILFFDEADSIAWNRDSTSPDSGVIRRATNSLFQHLDQMNKDNVFVSATNMLHRLDLAFERRFNMKFEFTRPKNIDEAIEKFIYPEFNLVDDVDKDIKRIVTSRALSSPKLSYDEIKIIVERAMKRAVIRDTLDVRTSEIFNDIAIAERVRITYKPEPDNTEQGAFLSKDDT